MEKPIFENLFINEKYAEEIEALYDKAEKLYQAEGKRYPIFQNNNYIEKEGATPKSISIWLNEKEGRKFITHKKENKKEGSFKKRDDVIDDNMPF
jgi:hypothetical protein|tara:strand:+ start:160 stop:444 length:285 start_codon:yes stop_codon:yes gene_type:complete